MKIHSISYQRVKNLGNYESERLEMTAELDEGENAIGCASVLRDLVEAHLNVRDSARKLEAEKFHLKAEIAQLQNKYEELKEVWDKVEPLLDANGIELPSIPF